MTDPILPTASELITPAIDAIVAARPSTLPHFNNPNSHYFGLTKIWRAQAELLIARLAAEVAAARLRTSTGPELAALCASEFETTLSVGPQSAIATVQLARWQGDLLPQVIRKGQLFKKTAAPTASPVPIAAATYQARGTTYIPAGQTWATIVADAVEPGPNANIPAFYSPVLLGFQASSGETTAQPAIGAAFTAFQSNPPAAGLALDSYVTLPGCGIYKVTEATPISDAIRYSLLNTGAASNVPAGQTLPVSVAYVSVVQPPAIQPSTPLGDTNLQVVYSEAAGGSSALTDPVLVAAAKAYARGQYGPTDGAIIAGALRSQAARYTAAFRAGALPYMLAYVADETWASGAAWADSIAQVVASDWLGFGGRVRWGSVQNQPVAVNATIVLKSTDDLSDTSSIDAAISMAVRAYFDGRPDWYLWRASALRAAIARADDRILRCTSVTLLDAMTGDAISEPDNTFGAVWSPTLTHYYVGSSLGAADNTLQTTYLPPE